MKIIFLDFDGVLNGHDWWSYERYLSQPCDPKLVAKLNGLIVRTKAYVVISSSWRHTWKFRGQCDSERGYKKYDAALPYLQDLLDKSDFAFRERVIDVTPRMDGQPRGLEIEAWLQGAHVVVDSFVILDDDDDMAHLDKHLVKCDTEVGLTDALVDKAASILNACERMCADVD